MKKVKKILAGMVMMMIVISIAPPEVKAAPPVSVSFQFFYDNLSPYGAWVSYSSYGYAWVPRVSGFRPYCTGGRWVFTDAGWMWASSYDWGWAPFHYGSWAYDSYYGWLWVPGYDWAPAWVTWGYYDGYYGWAPLGPGISFSVGYYPPINYWVFAPPRYVTVSGFNNNYYVYSGNRIALDGNTSISNVKSINVVDNTGSYGGKKFSAGPPKADFEKTANTKLNPVAVREHNQPGKADVSENAISVYRPKVDAADRKSAKPAKVIPLEEIKHTAGSKTGEPEKMKSREPEKKTAPEQTPEQKMKGNAPEKKAAPERKNDVKEKQPQMKEQPKQERKPEMKEQPKQQERKPEMKQPPKEQPQQNEKPKRDVQPQEKPKQEMQQQQSEPKREAAPSPQRTEKPQREEKPNMERQSLPGTPKQNYQPQPHPKQPQQREKHDKPK